VAQDDRLQVTADPAPGRAAAGGRGRLARGRQAGRRLAARVLRAELDALEQRLVLEIQASGRACAARDEQLRADQEAAAAQLAVAAQLTADLGARLAAVEMTLTGLGAAMSREHGLAGAPDAYREALYLLHEVRRDLRAHTLGHLTAWQQAAGQQAASTGTGSAADPYAGRHPRRFDYAGFERRFRGEPEAVRAVLTERYLPVLDGVQAGVGGPVVDIGCGRGELLEALQERGVEVVGVEPEPALAAQTRARGVPVVEALGADYLRGVEDGSLGAVVCLHVVEHLVVDDLIELLELAARKVRPGGVFVAETPNPMTFLTLHESYLLDPTHVQPLHPALLSWLAETAGFRSVDIAYHSPATSLWLPPLRGDGPLVEQLDAAFGRLNHQLYGPQDYSMVARA